MSAGIPEKHIGYTSRNNSYARITVVRTSEEKAKNNQERREADGRGAVNDGVSSLCREGQMPVGIPALGNAQGLGGEKRVGLKVRGIKPTRNAPGFQP